jgi:transcriptional regulator with XRE-family HTH domain
MSSPAIDGRLPPLHTRIRRRRIEKGLTGTDLAVRAGISTSYVSLIENGAKVPDEEAAARLARALDDDAALYRAWARAARLGLHDLAMLNELDAIARTPEFATLVESGQELPRLAPEPSRSEEKETSSDIAARLREVAYRLDPHSLPTPGSRRTPDRAVEKEAVVRVPVLGRGAEPQPGGLVAGGREHILVDRRLLADEARGPYFAYEVTDADARHLRGVAGPGDRVVLQPGGAVSPDRICAVRTDGGIRLSRVLVSEGLLVLLPGDGEAEFDSVALPAVGVSGVVVGTHVLLLRR